MKWFLLLLVLSGCSSPPETPQETIDQPGTVFTVVEDGPSGSRLRAFEVTSTGHVEVEVPVSRAADSQLPGATGVKTVLVMNVKRKPADPEPWTTVQSGNTVLGSMAAGMAAGSYGAMSVTGQSVGWYAVDLPFCANYLQVAPAVDNLAKAAGIPILTYTHRLYYGGSDDPSCTWNGMAANIGAGVSRIWVHSSLNPGLAGHEFGHTVAGTYGGLKHSHSCCPFVEYGNWTDPMGDGRGNPAITGQFGVHAKWLLGWLDSLGQPSSQTVTASGVYTIAPIEAATATAPRGLIINKGGGQRYYLQQRQNVVGVVVTSAPASSIDNDTLLAVGPSFTDPAVFSATVTAQTATLTTLSISFPGTGVPGPQGKPTVTP